MRNRRNIKKLLVEGAYWTGADKKVYYEPFQNINIDTSEENNPTQDYHNFHFGRDVEVWSIFRRQDSPYSEYDDSNPFLLALKGEGWRFAEDYMRDEVMEQVERICRKFVKTHSGPTIVIPSKSSLTQEFAEILMKCDDKCQIYNNILRKLRTFEVKRNVLKENSKFRQKYCNYEYETDEEDEDFLNKLDILNNYLKRMDKADNCTTGNGTFRIHWIINQEMRNTITQTLKRNENIPFSEMFDKFHNKDIIILDDSISRGTSMKNAIEIVKSFKPKSITVLTLFSRKYKQKEL